MELDLKLINDFKHEYKGFTGAPNGLCRIRIFSDDNNTRLVGICSALPENYTTSTTNVIEHIYADVKAKLFEQSIKNPSASPEETFRIIQDIAKILDSNKYWTLAVQITKALWVYKKKYDNSPIRKESPPILWVDHWPKSIGLRPWANEFSIIQFTDDLVPNWIKLSEEMFIEFTGIDIRLINELELVEEE